MRVESVIVRIRVDFECLQEILELIERMQGFCGILSDMNYAQNL